MKTLLAIVVLLVPALAHADSAPALTEASPGYRSPSMAFALSAGTTVGGVLLTWYGSGREGQTEERVVALGLTAAAVGPLVGNIYAGDTWNAGLAMRLASIGGGLVGVGIIAASQCFIECRGGSEGLAKVGFGVIVVSALTYAGATLYEIANAPHAARRRNERPIAIVPTISPQSAGLALGGSF